MSCSILGIDIDESGRCAHYASALDIVAIKFKCCNRYFGCHACHEATASHPAEFWEEDEFDTKAILCGRCKQEMTIRQYFSCESKCSNCSAPFNPKCKAHWNLYFKSAKKPSLC